MSADVQARDLGFFADAQTDGDRNEHQENQADDQGVRGACADADELRHDVAFDSADRDRSKHASEQRANDAADGVDTEGVERIVISQPGLEADDRAETSEAGGDTDDERRTNTDVARRGRDGDESRDRA